MRALALALVLLAGANCLASPSPADRVATGDWGGEGIHLGVQADRASVQLDCAHGAVEGPIPLDAEGRFDVAGRFVQERGGPVRRDDDQTGVRARYAGRVDGDRMTLRVAPEGGDALGPFTLRLGERPRLHRCR